MIYTIAKCIEDLQKCPDKELEVCIPIPGRGATPFDLLPIKAMFLQPSTAAVFLTEEQYNSILGR